MNDKKEIERLRKRLDAIEQYIVEEELEEIDNGN